MIFCILREAIFAIEKDCFFWGGVGLVFAILRKSGAIGIKTFLFFISVHAIEIQVKQHADVKHVSATLLQVYLALV